MSITTFIDPLGSMVQGYKEGQQTELQRQAGRRAMRDSDYEYRLRQIQDPMRTRNLNTQMHQGLFDLLTSREQAPIQTNTMQANLEGLRRQADFERQTADARIRAANMQPDQVTAELNARAAQTNSALASAAMTNAQRQGVEFSNTFNERTMTPMMENPLVFHQTLVAKGLDPMLSQLMTKQYFPNFSFQQNPMIQGQQQQQNNQADAINLSDNWLDP